MIGKEKKKKDFHQGLEGGEVKTLHCEGGWSLFGGKGTPLPSKTKNREGGKKKGEKGGCRSFSTLDVAKKKKKKKAPLSSELLVLMEKKKKKRKKKGPRPSFYREGESL